MSSSEIENLAVMFRVDDPNLGHVSVIEAMTELGVAYTYGLYRGTPKHHKQERKRLREAIAERLSTIAKNAGRAA
jgi:hypothetical protein